MFMITLSFSFETAMGHLYFTIGMIHTSGLEYRILGTNRSFYAPYPFRVSNINCPYNIKKYVVRLFPDSVHKDSVS